ncbi:MAG: hypothetical protein IT349_15760 [Candidatus Eisenbacteria bacterium]|nr:hypothetical protein [Candidatus Eisenbacteria bacterium]
MPRPFALVPPRSPRFSSFRSTAWIGVVLLAICCSGCASLLGFGIGAAIDNAAATEEPATFAALDAREGSKVELVLADGVRRSGVLRVTASETDTLVTLVERGGGGTIFASANPGTATRPISEVSAVRVRPHTARSLFGGLGLLIDSSVLLIGLQMSDWGLR